MSGKILWKWITTAQFLSHDSDWSHCLFSPEEKIHPYAKDNNKYTYMYTGSGSNTKILCVLQIASLIYLLWLMLPHRVSVRSDSTPWFTNRSIFRNQTSWFLGQTRTRTDWPSHWLPNGGSQTSGVREKLNKKHNDRVDTGWNHPIRSFIGSLRVLHWALHQYSKLLSWCDFENKVSKGVGRTRL